MWPTYRHRGFRNHHRVPLQALADGSRHAEHVAQVGRTVLARGRAHGDQLEQAMIDRPVGVGREFQPAAGPVAPDQGDRKSVV